MTDRTPDDPSLADAVALCQDKLAREDLGQYYALLFLPAAPRASAAALYALWLELREIGDECADAEIARVKLAWWHEELQRMYSGQPRHPLARALAPVAAQHAPSAGGFDTVLAALARHFSVNAYATYAALQEHGRHSRGHIESLAARMAGHTDSASLARAVELGATLEVLALYRRAGVDARRGRVYIPGADLARFGVRIDDILADRDHPALEAIMEHAARRLDDELAQHALALAHGDSAWLSASRLAVSTAQSLVARIRSNPRAAWREPPAPASWRLLWNAWRAARRERRGALR